MRYLLSGIFVLILLLGSCSFVASSHVYWLKPGAKITYFANTTPADPGRVNGMLVYHRGGCDFRVFYPYVNLSFQVVNTNGDMAYIDVAVAMTYNSNLTKIVNLSSPSEDIFGYVVVQYNASCGKLPFQGYLTTFNLTSPESGTEVDYAVYKNLTIRGVYRVSMTNGSVYSPGGGYLGHTVLFGFYPPSNGTPLLVLHNKPLYPEKIRVVNTTEITYMGKFSGPNVIVESPLVSIANGSIFSRLVVTYNPSYKIALGFVGVVPDLEAIGVEFLGAFDNRAFEYSRTHAKELRTYNPREDMVSGVSLSSASFIGNASSIHARPPSSNWRWFYVAGGIFLAVVILLARRRK